MPAAASAANRAFRSSSSAAPCAISCSTRRATTSTSRSRPTRRRSPTAGRSRGRARHHPHPLRHRTRLQPRLPTRPRRARRETYPHPGSLPVVEPATLDEDLARRDFTINAFALRLEPRAGRDRRPIPRRQRRAQQPDPGPARPQLPGRRHAHAARPCATPRASASRSHPRPRPCIRNDLPSLGTHQRRPPAPGARPAVRGALRGQGRTPGAGPRRARGDPPGPRAEQRRRAALAGGHRGPTKLAPLDELGFCVIANPKDEGTAASVSKWLHLAGRVEHALTTSCA